MNKLAVLAKIMNPSEVIRKEVKKFGSLDLSPELLTELSNPGDNVSCKDLIQDELLPVLCILYLKLMPYYLEFVELWIILSECLKDEPRCLQCLSGTMPIAREEAEFAKSLNLEIEVDEQLLRECLLLFGNLEIFNIHVSAVCMSKTNSMYMSEDNKICMLPQSVSILDCINMILLYKTFRHPALGPLLYQGYDPIIVFGCDEPMEVASNTILNPLYNWENVGKSELRLRLEGIFGKIGSFFGI